MATQRLGQFAGKKAFPKSGVGMLLARGLAVPWRLIGYDDFKPAYFRGHAVGYGSTSVGTFPEVRSAPTSGWLSNA